ncbi:heavy metal translocating P-type ATPase [Catenuloplanes indicus]|uniref:Heavy metal translocating P-type ATPase n=1 Tax=Catenuloplanes indicus TaxID=137267 RepID=A0AAE3VSQ3_9ACTN|nr:heavy metal translocating P-type ATPase [Catenuloplanes indicus]MDQ0363568.1 heavy metal translocating P-type ATPase [Catenuloplanes indicus]
MLFAVAGLLTAAGAAARAAGAGPLADVAWTVAAVLGLAYSTVTLARAVRRREPSVDVIAWLALAGAPAVGETFAGAVIAMMLAGGALLEARAAARARRELSALAARAPRTARRRTAAGSTEILAGEVVAGDRLVVATGEIVPVDGRLCGPATLDESALTGEPMPVSRRIGTDVRSGVVNAGPAVEMIATATAESSTYAGVVRLVERARAASAPAARAADRLAVVFVPVTLLLAGAAWAVSGDPARVVAVLVVATPCPLLLAVPIAIMSGLSRAARTGVIVKGGAVLERLASGRTLLFDKTGTLTAGRPVLTAVTAAPGGDGAEVLRLAASVDAVSAHVLAAAIVTAAADRGLRTEDPAGVREEPGHGVEGLVAGRRVRLGRLAWAVPGEPPAWLRSARRRAALDGSLAVFVSVDGVPAGVLLLEDRIRPQAPRMLRTVRQAGVDRIVLVTGDRADTAEAVGRIVGVDAVHADCDPAGKVAVVARERRTGPVVMVGDGINDAPALAAADVGVALAARGATASAETADVVLTVDRIDVLADAILIARRCRTVALTAALAGMGAAAVAMLAAAAGWLPPAAGALLQELIDVAAIGIALTALSPGRAHPARIAPAESAVARRLHAEHRAVRGLIERVRSVADALTGPPYDIAPVRDLCTLLKAELLPHERAEEAQLLPIVARALGPEAVGALSRTHAEIEHQVHRLDRCLADLTAGAEPEDVVDLRRLLYGLYAVLRLHDDQEEEGAFSLVPADDGRAAQSRPARGPGPSGTGPAPAANRR